MSPTILVDRCRDSTTSFCSTHCRNALSRAQPTSTFTALARVWSFYFTPLKAVLFQYDLLAGSTHERKSITASSSPSSSSIPGAPASPSASFYPLTPSGENLVDEITGVLGKGRGDRLQELGRALIADLKDKMGASVASSSAPTPPAKQQREQRPRVSQDSDPKAKYMEKVRLGSAIHKAGGPHNTQLVTNGSATTALVRSQRHFL